MRLMAASGVKALPVVRRDNLRSVAGVISLPDILAAYGFGTAPRPREPEREEVAPPAPKVLAVTIVMMGALLLTAFVSYYYRAQRQSRAQQFFQAGQTLMQGGRYAEAVEQYRNALSISGSAASRLALGLALVKAQRTEEAEVYLREAARRDPASGPVNLGLAEASAADGKTDEAVACFHRAIYGDWPDHPAQNRLQARFELVDALGQAGRVKQAQAELLALQANAPADPGTEKQIAGLLLNYGLPQQSADAFLRLSKGQRADAEVYAGLGEADLQLADYLGARAAFHEAAQLNPGDASLQRRLTLCEQLIALDPSAKGLRAAERFRRAQTLLRLTLAEADRCAAAHADAYPAASAGSLPTSARRELALRRAPASYADAVETEVALAAQLWATLPGACRSEALGSEALTQLLMSASH
jgi:tetratricopeptide (TPR) repeat protein